MPISAPFPSSLYNQKFNVAAARIYECGKIHGNKSGVWIGGEQSEVGSRK